MRQISKLLTNIIGFYFVLFLFGVGWCEGVQFLVENVDTEMLPNVQQALVMRHRRTTDSAVDEKQVVFFVFPDINIRLGTVYDVTENNT